MLGVSLSGDIGYATTKNKSTLAEELAPPKKSKMGCLIFFVGFMLAGAVKEGPALVFVIILTFAFYFVTKTKRDNEYNEALRAWSNKWLCMKCGKTFIS